MKTFIVSIIFIISVISCTSGLTDYCKLCSNHIACKNNGQFNKTTCPSIAEIVKLTQAEKDLFVKIHNELRNQIAGGKIPGYKSAANMSAVVWDEELAYFAELNRKQCNGHDPCHDTLKYSGAGQNLAGAWGYGSFPPLNNEITNSLQRWFDEYKNPKAKIDINACCSIGAGHFTQFVQYRVVAIGCGVMRYTDTKKNYKGTDIACNYSFGNLVGAPIYIPGPPASSCKNGKHKVYENLCK